MSELHVYGATCFWHDSINNIGIREHELPCCPHCRGILFQAEVDEWWNGARKYEQDGHPGYEEFLKWSQGRCFKTRQDAANAYRAETKKEVVE